MGITLGVIGGVGPGSTGAFYQSVVRRYAERRKGDQPALLIYSVPIEAEIERVMLEGATSGPEVDRLRLMLEDGVRRLAQASAEAIVMPCNTLQAYLPDIVARAGLPYIPLIAESVSRLKQQGYRRPALICTAPMRSLGLYQKELEARAVSYLLPTEAEQRTITQALLDTLHHAPDPNALLRPVLRRLESEADSILLGCSDLTAFADPIFTRLPVVDAMDVLADATVEFLLSVQ